VPRLDPRLLLEGRERNGSEAWTSALHQARPGDQVAQ
jgi:hypothetical protein